MAGKRPRRVRMERVAALGMTIRTRPATIRADLMRLAESLPAEALALAIRRIRAFLARRRGI